MAVDSFGPVETDPLVLREVPIPEPGAGDIRLRIQACGVCRTDLHVVEGELDPKRAGIVPGHHHERVLRSVANLTRADVGEFLEMELQEPFHVDVNVFPLEDADLALRKVKSSAFQGSAVLAVAGD